MNCSGRRSETASTFEPVTEVAGVELHTDSATSVAGSEDLRLGGGLAWFHRLLRFRITIAELLQLFV